MGECGPQMSPFFDLTIKHIQFVQHFIIKFVGGKKFNWFLYKRSLSSKYIVVTIQKSIYSLLTAIETGKLPNNLKKFWIGLVINMIMLKNFNIQSKYIYSCLYSPCPSVSDTSPMSITSLRCLVQRLMKKIYLYSQN